MNQKNRGYTTIETSMVMAIFLFFMLGMCGLYMVIMAEAHVHQALASAVDYAAQYSYWESRLLLNEKSNDKKYSVNNLVDAVVIKQRLNTYIGNDLYVEKMIVGGKNGIYVTVESDSFNDKVMLVTAKYVAKITLPLLGTYSIPLSNQIKQKTLVGFSKEEYINGDYYVYVTPNREAYHMRRDCTHLVLDIKSVPSKYQNRYTPCYYCGVQKTNKWLYVTKENDVYHSTKDCVGLKRTVMRVKLSAVKGVSACSRCSG